MSTIATIRTALEAKTAELGQLLREFGIGARRFDRKVPPLYMKTWRTYHPGSGADIRCCECGGEVEPWEVAAYDPAQSMCTRCDYAAHKL